MSESTAEIQINPVKNEVLGQTPQNPFFEGVVRGNGEFPRMGAGMYLYGGSALMSQLESGQITWPQFTESEVSPSELDDFRQRMKSLHRAFDVSYLPSDEELQELYAQAKKRVSNICLNYAETVDENLFPDDIESVYDPKVTDCLNTFFTDPQYSQSQAGLSALWSIGAEALLSPEGKAIGREVREASRGGRTIPDAEIAKRFRELRAVVRENIDKDTSNTIPPEAVDSFLIYAVAP
ncbi:MAG TPA: hypothetical protein VLF93_07940 [Candidatus Saccharimonadales bacterium]|nr:hypothetical protein [Candidatus Saccharimonadales bacterium]